MFGSLRAFVSLWCLLVLAGVGLAQQDNNTVYHIFVRSFADTPGDTAPHGTGEIGDLKGIRENLDYLNDGDPKTDRDLEVGILWLMPIFPTTTYHGYDVTNFQAVNPEYGTMQDLDDLIKAAHQRGVRIILDIPFNHTSDQHPWFKQAVENSASPFRRFYHFADASSPAPSNQWYIATSSTGMQVRYFGLFDKSMPDLNFDEPEVRKQVKSIARFWLARGIDGFRLDAAKHIYGDTFDAIPEPDILKNNDWWREFSDFVYTINPNAVLVGEVLGSRETMRRHAYGLDEELNDSLLTDARSRIAFPSVGFINSWSETVRNCRDVNRLAHMGPGSTPRSEPFQPFFFLASHDANPRLASFLEDMKQNHGMQSSVDQAYRVGMYLLTSLPKYPVLYEGDELMQRGFKWNGNPPSGKPPGDGSNIFDETLREPFPWLKAGSQAPQTSWFHSRFDLPNDNISVQEENTAGSMLDLVRGLTNLRTAHPAYANGDVGAILTDSNEWLVFEKIAAQDSYLVLINTTPTGNTYQFHAGWFPRYIGAQLVFWSDGQAKTWKDETLSGKNIDKSVFVAPYGFVLLRQKH